MLLNPFGRNPIRDAPRTQCSQCPGPFSGVADEAHTTSSPQRPACKSSHMSCGQVGTSEAPRGTMGAKSSLSRTDAAERVV